MKTNTSIKAVIMFMLLAWMILGPGTHGSAKDTNHTVREISWSSFQEPPVEYRPWVRWWWPGDDVDDVELKREVDLLADKGFGGAEVQAFTMGLNAKAGADEIERRMGFDTESFYGHLATVMEQAQAKGLSIDLNLGSGWPSGGAHISAQQGLKTLLWSEQVVRGPKKIEVKLKRPKKPIFYTLATIIGAVMNQELATYHGPEAEVVAVVAARLVGGKRSKSPLNLSDALDLDPQSVQVITGQVDAGGILAWQVPDGKWIIVTVYSAPGGERPTLSAQADPGYVTDHFDKKTAVYHLDHLLGERTGLSEYFGGPMRAFFNDSFEFKTERHFTPDFFDEFKRRRGYDLIPFLPAVLVPGGDNFFIETSGLPRASEYNLSDHDRRVRYDFSLTVSDLFIERYLDTSREWAADRGLLSRAQSYGLNIDIIRAAGHNHIPETEQLYGGGSEMFLKITSSSAHLYNKPLVTSESMVWSGRDYMTTPHKIKAGADKLFTSGINQIIYHGYSYKKDNGYGETGWYPWSSPYTPWGAFGSNISEASPFWKYMDRINRYIARCQYLLRQGEPEVDLLVYFPWLGFPSSFSAAPGHDEMLFNGRQGEAEPDLGGDQLALLQVFIPKTELDPRSEWLAELWPLLQDLESRGYTWDWVNDESLAIAKLNNGMMDIRGNTYKALVIADAPWMQPEAAENMAELSEKDAAILIVGEPPVEQPGFNDHMQGDLRVKKAMAGIAGGRRARKANTHEEATRKLDGIGIGPGIGYVGFSYYTDNDYRDLPVRHIRHRFSDNSSIIFFNNPSRWEARFRFRVEGGCENGAWLDAWTGEAYKTTQSEDGHLDAVLNPGSMFLVCGDHGKDFEYVPLPRYHSEKNTSRNIPIESWRLEVIGDDVKGRSLDLELEELSDWRDIKELRYCSSPGVYRTDVNVGETQITAGKIELDLGWVYGAAEIKINGRDAGTLLIPPYKLDVTDVIKPGGNSIEVTVIPALRNRFIGKAIKRDKKYKQFKSRKDTVLPSGLVGPTWLIYYR